MQAPLTVDGTSPDILAVANSPVLWIGAIGVLVTIAIQSLIYYAAVKKAAPDAGMPQEEVRTALRAGAVSAIGPSLAVAMVAIALIALLGSPSTLVRIGLIGNAAYETLSADIASGVIGGELGTPSYTQGVFAATLLVMTIGGSMWMLVTLIVTPILKRGQKAAVKANPMVLVIVPAAALAGAFFTTTGFELAKGSVQIATIATSAVIMGACLAIASMLKQHWLKEWALGFAIIGGIAVAYVLTN